MKNGSFAALLALPFLALTNACSTPAPAEGHGETMAALDGSNVHVELGELKTLRWASGVDEGGALHSLRVFRSGFRTQVAMADGTTSERRYSMMRHVYATNGARTLDVVAAFAPFAATMIVYVSSKDGTVACDLDQSGAAFGRPGRASAWSIPARGEPVPLGSDVYDPASSGGLGKACVSAVARVAERHLEDVAYFSPVLHTLLQGDLTAMQVMQETPGHNKGIAIGAATAGGIALAVGLAAAAIATSPVTLTVGAGIAIGVLAAELGVLVGDAITHHYDGTDKPPPSGGGRGNGAGGGGASNDPGAGGRDEDAFADLVALAESEDTPSAWSPAGEDCFPPGSGGNGSGSGFDCTPENQFASSVIHLTRWCQ